MRHATHHMHENSLAAWAALDPRARRTQVLAEYCGSMAPLTDRELAERLGFSDLNAVRPRITELIARGLVLEIAKVKDAVTGVSVRVCTNALVLRPRDVGTPPPESEESINNHHQHERNGDHHE